MNLQFFKYSDDSILKYETDYIISDDRIDDIQNTIVFDTLGGNKTIQKIRNPIDSYEFSLQGVNSYDFEQFKQHLRLNNYGIKCLYPKSNYGLETKRGGMITNIKINSEKYKHYNLSDPNRPIDVTFRFTPFAWSN